MNWHKSRLKPDVAIAVPTERRISDGTSGAAFLSNSTERYEYAYALQQAKNRSWLAEIANLVVFARRHYTAPGIWASLRSLLLLQVDPRHDRLFESSDVNIPLRKRDIDAGFPERPVDGDVEIVDGRQANVHT